MVMGTLDVSATDAAKTSASGAHDDDDDDVDDDESLLCRGEGAHAMAGIRLDLGNRQSIPPALLLAAGSSTLQVFWIKKGKMKEMTVSNISPGVGVMCEGGGIE